MALHGAHHVTVDAARASLFFATLASFEDPFEGVPPPAVLAAARNARRPDAADAARRLAAWRTMIERCRATVCASCWHRGDEESEAMWNLYGRFEDGLAIVSTLQSIRATIRDHDVTGGLVDYSGREFEPGEADENLLRWATTTRTSCRHECEFRLLAWRRPNERDARGLSVPVDPDLLIGEVVLSPRMQRWQIDLFRGLLDRLAFKRPVRGSSLLTSPF